MAIETKTALPFAIENSYFTWLHRPCEVDDWLLAAINVSYQTSEMIGFFTGSSIVIGAGPALGGDAVTFLLSALLLTGLHMAAPGRSRDRSSLTTGVRTIFANPTLRVLAPVAWAGLTMGALPATLATTALPGSYHGWVPAAMAARARSSAVATWRSGC